MDTEAPRRPKHPTRWSAGLALGLLGLVAWTAPHAVQAGDAGEFATVMLRGGIPHPSGYPWMRGLGVVALGFERLGLAPALAASLPCAIAATAAWLVLHRICVAWERAASGAIAIAIVACSGVVVSHVHDSEVWGLHLLFCALVLHAALLGRAGPLRIGVLLGLAASHHLTAVLLVPLAIGAAWSSQPRALARAGALGLLGSAIGLLPYVTLAVGEGGAWRWGDTRSAAGLWHHVTRADYGVTQLSLHDESVAVIDLWARSMQTIGGALSAQLTVHVTLALALLGALAYFARRPPVVPRSAWIGLWGAIVATTGLFPALQNIDPTSPFGAWILERFDLLAILLWTLPAVTVLARVHDHLATRRLRLLGIVAPAALVVRQLAETWLRGVPSEEAGVQAYAIDLRQTPPAAAIVFGTDDHRVFPVLFAEQVLGTRPDVLYLDASLLWHSWYRERAHTRWPGLPLADKPLASMDAIWRDPTWRDTPIYVANVFSRPAAQQLNLVPEGILWRVVPPGSDPASFGPEAVTARHLDAFSRYTATPEDFAGLHSPHAHPWSVDLWQPYLDHTRQLAQAMRAGGREDLALRLDAVAARYAP